MMTMIKRKASPTEVGASMQARVCDYYFNYTSKSTLSNVSNEPVADAYHSAWDALDKHEYPLWKIRCKIKSFNNGTEVIRTFLFIENFSGVKEFA